MWFANDFRANAAAKVILIYNPFYYMLEILRAPVFNGSMDIQNLIIGLLISAALAVLSFIAFARTRGRIAFWI